jgi:hypothetical protein
MSHLGPIVRRIPYPLRAARISFAFAPFTFWKPSFTHRKSLTEKARANGETIWWARFAWFQISYSRML